MRITLNKRFEIDIDKIGNHTLIEYVIPTKGKNIGKDSENIIGYYNSVGAAVCKYIQITLLAGPEKETLLEYIERYENAAKTILERLAGFGKIKE